MSFHSIVRIALAHFPLQVNMSATQDVPSIAKVSTWMKDDVKNTTESYLKEYKNSFVHFPDESCTYVLLPFQR